jgi:uncharacterized membrane-anchored protein
MAQKVPEITAYFWIVKALTTAMGESTSDFLVHAMPPVVAVLLGFVGFIVALALQLAARTYRVWRYWFAVAMVGVFGTMAADVLHVGLGVPYAVSTVGFALLLAVVFAGWFSTEHTLSMHSVCAGRREAFYWAAVIATFALGTAAGDLAATTLHLGFLAAGVGFAVLILVPDAGYARFGWNAVACFWISYVLTRPVGASFADWFGVSHARGGLALGSGPVSVVLTVLILVLVAYLARTRIDVPSRRYPSLDSQSAQRSTDPVTEWGA